MSEATVEVDQLVVVSANSPREKFWGVLLSLNTAGVTLRGLALDSFEDWLHQFVSDGPRLLGTVTLFLPAHRIERVEIDETTGAVEGYTDRFARLTGRNAHEEVLRTAQPPSDNRRQM
jgi:hypothetical protein